MGGIFPGKPVIGGVVSSPGLPVQTTPYTGLYELPSLDGVGLSINALGYFEARASGFNYGHKPNPPFSVSVAGSASTGVSSNPTNIAFTPNGQFMFAADPTNNHILMWSVNSTTGVLTPVVGSPIAAAPAATASGVFISPDGSHLFVTNSIAANVYVYYINYVNGTITPVGGSPFATSAAASSVSFSPDGSKVFCTALANNNVTVFTINNGTGALTPVVGSPFNVGGVSSSSVVSPDGAHLYVALQTAGEVAAFNISSSGSLTAVAGSPYVVGATARTVAVSPDGKFVFITCYGTSRLYVFARDAVTGALTNAPSSPFVTGAGPWGVAVSPDNSHVWVSNALSNSVSAFALNSSTGFLTPEAGSPYATTSQPEGIAVSPNSLVVYTACANASAVYGFLTSASPTFNLLNMIFDPLGGSNGVFNVNGVLSVLGAPVIAIPLTSGNPGKYLRVNTAGTATLWDGVNSYLPVAMVANAGAFSVDDTGQYTIEVTGALTANGALTATFTIPADPLTVIFDNATTGNFPLILNATYTLPRGRSYWYWNGTTLELVAENIRAGYTVATLPPGIVGMRAYVTDANAPTWNGALVGGGAVTCPVFYNGTAWVSA